MTDIVNIASNAISAYQRSLGTISNNIANVATVGYSRQEAVLEANPVSRVGNNFFGTGVTVARVQRQYDAFVESNLRGSNSDLSSQEPMVNYANRVIDIMGGPSMGLSSALDQFFGSARNLSTDPASSVLRGSFVRDADSLATRFNQLSSQFDLVQTETDQLVEGQVSAMNTIIAQLKEVNVQLTKQKSATSQPADLLDQRDSLLKDLSSYAKTNTYFQENGAVNVSLGPSITRDLVVDGIKSFRIGTTFSAASPEKVALVIDPYGSPSPLTSITSGKLSGLMSFREQVLGSSRSALNVLANTVVTEVNALHKGGIDAYGDKGVALFSIDNKSVASAGTMKVDFSDPLRVAAAAQFRVVEAPNNISGVDANVSYADPVVTGPKALNDALVNNPNASAGVKLNISDNRPVGPVATIPNGFNDVQIFLGEADPGQQLQVFTRDGRQIIGSSMDLNTTLQGQVMTEANGFVPNASYSAAYLNVNGVSSYKDLSVFYGAKATALEVKQWDMTDKDPEKHTTLASTQTPPLLEGDRMLALSSIAQGAFTLNGVSLSAASPSVSGVMQARDLKTWIDSNISTNSSLTGFSVTAQNDIKVQAKNINLNLSVYLKGGSGTEVQITAPSGGFANLQTMVDAINTARTSNPDFRILASQDPNGDLVLTNTNGYAGEDISVGASPIPNALGLSSGTYKGKISITRTLNSGDNTVALGFGTGTPAELAQLGFRSAAYINGNANEDLLVFVTGAGEAKVAASYKGAPANNKESLRAQPLQIKFDSATHYTITDLKTETVVASRNFDPTQQELFLTYQGLKVSFSNGPKTGDIYTIDGNKDGTGNNENMLAIADLESKGVMGGGKTMGAYYIDHVNDMGNVARQAAISQSALQVVYDQAVKARDDVSGVSLDQEAADLIRFQQAYQAAAKILQVASQLFDSVLQVR